MAIINLFKKSGGPQRTASIEGEGEFVSLASSQTSSSINPYVYRCADLRATSVSSLTPIVYNKEGNAEDNHPIKLLMDRPNPVNTWSELCYNLGIDLAYKGNYYLLPVETIKGPVELWRVDPDKVSTMGTGDLFKPFEYWTINTGSSVISLPYGKLLHGHTQLGKDGIKGVAPLEAAGLSIKNQNDAREWNSATLQNGAKPSVVISDPNIMATTQFEDFKKRVVSMFSGKRNAGRMMIVDGGKTVTPIGFTPLDMDFSAGITISAREIAIAMSIPPEMLGDSANKTYSNMQESTRQYATHFVIPTANELFSLLTRYFNKWYPDIRVGYDPMEIDGMKGDQTSLITALTSANYLTINEKRAMLSYDEVEGGDVVLQPLGQAPLKEVSTDIDSLIATEET